MVLEHRSTISHSYLSQLLQISSSSAQLKADSQANASRAVVNMLGNKSARDHVSLAFGYIDSGSCLLLQTAQMIMHRFHEVYCSVECGK